MNANPEVVSALNVVYPLGLTLKEQSHKQEHEFESAGYDKLEKWFDKLNNCVYKVVVHGLTEWFAEHKAESNSELLGVEVAPADQPTLAFQYTRDMLTSLHEAYRATCDKAEEVEDYVTVKMIWKHLKKVEKWLDKTDAELGQIEVLGPTLYLQEMM